MIAMARIGRLSTLVIAIPASAACSHYGSEPAIPTRFVAFAARQASVPLEHPLELGISSYPSRPRNGFFWRSTDSVAVSVSEIGVALAHSAATVGIWAVMKEDTTLRDSMTLNVTSASGARPARR